MRPRRTTAQKAARRRLSSVTAENCGKVLARATYWTTDFLELYLDRCDEAGLHLPAEGYVLARQAPELASRIRVGEGEGEFAAEAEKLSARVTAAAVLSSCCRSWGKLREAELAILWAQDLALGAPLSPRAACELVRRYAALKVTRTEADAEAWVEQAVALAERLDERENLADALVMRGTFLAHAERGGVEDVVRGLSIADLKQPRGRRTFDAGLFNISHGALRAGNRAEATRWLARIKKRMARLPRSVNKLRVAWMEAVFSAELGSVRYAIRLLERSRLHLFELEAVADFVACSMDLVGIHLLDGDLAEAQAVVEETRRRLETLALDQAWAGDLVPLVKTWGQVGNSSVKWDRCRQEMSLALCSSGRRRVGDTFR